jgi:TRAP-type C4-dicarboxylate transport system permease small subunit
MLAKLKTFLGLGLVMMVLLNFLNAIARYSGLHAFSGIDELLVYSMIWLVMIGAIVAMRERLHISITLLPTALGSWSKQVLLFGLSCVSTVVSGFIAWQSLAFIERIFAIGQKSMGLGVPMVVPHLAIFTGFAGMAIVSLALSIADLRILLGVGTD